MFELLLMVCITAIFVVVCSIIGLIVVVVQLCNTMIKISVIQKSETPVQAQKIAETNIKQKEKKNEKTEKIIEKKELMDLEIETIKKKNELEEKGDWTNVG